jgi:MFS family permease
MIAQLGLPSILTLNSICIGYFLIILIIIGRFPQTLSQSTRGKLESIKDGIRFVKNSSLIWSSMILDFFATFFSSGMTLMPIFAKDILAVGPEGLGMLYAAPSIGGIIAALFFSSFKKVSKQGLILIISIVIYGLTTIVFGLSQSFILSLIMMAFVGAADMVSSIIRNTLRQMVTPDHLRGRMVSINMIFYLGGPQLGEVESGLLASLIGTPYTVVIGGIATIITTVFFTLRIPKLVKYEN